MPSRERESTIGIFGTGEVSEVLNEQLLADQARGEIRFIIGYSPTPAIQEAIYFARDEGIPFEFVAEPDVDLPKGAVRVTQAANVPTKVVQLLEREKNPKLLVYWSEEDKSGHAAIRRAIEAEIEVRDMCDALTRLGKLIDPEESQVADKQYTRAELEAMEDEEIRPIANGMGIDPDDFGDWDEVIDQMLAYQEGDAGGGPEDHDGGDDTSEEEEDEEEGGFYTKEELEEFDLDDLKQLCTLNEIEIPGERPRKPTYIKAILDFQKAQAEAEEKPAAEKKTSTKAAAAGTIADGASIVTTLEDFGKKLLSQVDSRFTQMVADLDQAVANTLEEALKAVEDRIKELIPKATTANGTAEKPAAPVAKKIRTIKK